MNHYDLFVIGAGSGGVRASRLAAQTGARVAVAENRFLGGTCVNVGCVPKKLFYYGSHYHEDFADAAGYGWTGNALAHNWSTLKENKDKEIARLNGIYQNLLEKAGVDIIRGTASLLSNGEVSVDGQVFTAERILVATGGEPFVPDFTGSELVVTSDDIFALDALPERAVVVGGGYIAVEFAGILNGLGVSTSLVYRGDQLLRHFDHSLGQRIARELASKGVDLRLEADIASISESSAGLDVALASGEKLASDMVLYATGRKPKTAVLGLDQLGVELRDNGTLVVDEHFQTSVQGVYALGDVIGTPELTPVALAQGNVFVDTWYRDKPRTVSYDNLATAIFCQPNIATVGLSEEQANERVAENGEVFDIFTSEFRHLKHTLSGNDEKTYMKVIVERDSDRVVGVHMLGVEAGEIIQGMAVALNAGVTKTDFDNTIGIHPTAAEEFVTMRQVTRTLSGAK